MGSEWEMPENSCSRRPSPHPVRGGLWRWEREPAGDGRPSRRSLPKQRSPRSRSAGRAGADGNGWCAAETSAGTCPRGRALARLGPGRRPWPAWGERRCDRGTDARCGLAETLRPGRPGGWDVREEPRPGRVRHPVPGRFWRCGKRDGMWERSRFWRQAGGKFAPGRLARMASARGRPFPAAGLRLGVAPDRRDGSRIGQITVAAS